MALKEVKVFQARRAPRQSDDDSSRTAQRGRIDPMHDDVVTVCATPRFGGASLFDRGALLLEVLALGTNDQ